MKKLFSTVVFFVASTMLANAANVVYTFNLDSDIPTGVTKNLSANNVPDSGTTAITETMGQGTLTVSVSGGKLWSNTGNAFTSEKLSALASNPTATELLTSAGLTNASADFTKITKGTQNGSGQSATTTFAVTGLVANSQYTVTMLVGPSTNKGKISWDTGTFISGKYAYSNAASTTIGESATSLVLDNLSVVSLTLAADSSGAFNIKLYNNSNDNTGGKTAIGLFAISGDAIPEPSAFGLLAGLGAIALAVSRRRRSRH